MLSLTVENIIQETGDTITLILNPGTALFHYLPGQYITLLIPIEGVPYYRSYSLSTAPQIDPMPSITIKRVTQGKVSNYLHDHIKKGDIIEAIPPQGHMTLASKRNTAQHLCLIAGGSGITPLYSILKGALHENKIMTVHLINANRHESSIIYKKELDSWQQQYGNRLKITHLLSQPSAEWKGKKSRLTPTILENLIQDKSFTSTDYYICAPEGLMEMAISTLLTKGVAATAIHRESFVSSQKDAAVDSVEAEVTLHVGSYQENYNVPAGDTILEAALNEGVYSLAYSCMSGICNTCRAQCLKGKVHMETDEGLSEKEKKDGYILTCVARPLTQEVELKVD